MKVGGNGLKVGKSMNAGSKGIKAAQTFKAGQATMNSVKTVSAIAVATTVASVAFTIVDVGFLIASWVQGHPTIDHIKKLVQQLEDEIKKFSKLRKTIDSFKEKAYVSELDEITLFGTSGKYVINSGVLRIQRDIIDQFLNNHPNGSKRTIEQVRQKLGYDSGLVKDYFQPMQENIQQNIRTNMVAHIEYDFQYIDSNTFFYGSLIQILRETCVLHMKELYNETARLDSKHTTKIKTTNLTINRLNVYVDEIAKAYWLEYQEGDWIMFENSDIAVKDMLQNLYDKLADWVNQLKIAGL